MSNSKSYTLSLKELGKIQKLIRLQNILGEGRPVLSKDSNIEVIKLIGGGIKINMFYNEFTPERLDGLLLGYKKSFTNSQVLSWIGGLTTNIISFKTSYNNNQENYTNLFISYAYGQYATASKDWQKKSVSQMWKGFSEGTRISQFDTDFYKHSDSAIPSVADVRKFPTPGKPSGGNPANDWASSINKTFNTISNNPPNSLFQTSGSNYNGFVATQSGTIDPENWKNNGEFKKSVSQLWNDQFKALNDMKSGKLDYDQCVFLLYLMIGLDTGSKAHQDAVNTITSASCSSREKRNSTFANNLIYLILMILANPLGHYAQSNTEIQKLINDLIELIVSTTPGSKAIKDALGVEAKILKASNGYPMSDPYNPETGFNTRMSDVLDALNQTWSTLKI